ncbi:VOC family protein [Lysobacter sp. A6]|uniref:VOC family protein n=1 Tax=Noviluteimonas lactosilytica TaxID=2888523 RepID=A0ABS8JE47_9GAMM|nr:VOC family protein [Lysobacter lactosilyticus]MCC8361880.1 VOC family protein [Lysobacter lactosilyticus]
MAVPFMPAGYHSLTPSVVVDDAKKAMDFYSTAFGAKETFRMPMGDKIAHAEMDIDGSRFMLSDEFPEWGALSPKSRGGATGGMLIYVKDADASIDRAVKAGATVVQPAEDQFWGDRMGTVVDPFGHKWMLGTHKEEVSPEEMQRRGDAWIKEMEQMGRQ